MTVLDSVLQKYGFEMQLNPYRIVDSRTKKVVLTGPAFDVTEGHLSALRASVARSEGLRFKKVS